MRRALLFVLLVVTSCSPASSASSVGEPEIVAMRPDSVASEPASDSTPVSMPSATPTLQAKEVLWASSFESGDFSEWEANEGGGVFNTGTGVAEIVTDPVRTGSYAAKMEISGADEDVQAVRIFRWNESKRYEDGYFSAWFYFPERYHPEVWWNIFQFKSQPEGEEDSQSAWSLNVGNRLSGEMYIYLWNAVDNRSYEQTLVDLPENQWVHLEAYYQRSTERTGQVKIWQDDTLLFNVDQVQTAFADNAYWSLDNYTDDISPSTATIYVDDAVISTERVGTRPAPSLGYSVFLPLVLRHGAVLADTLQRGLFALITSPYRSSHSGVSRSGCRSDRSLA